MNIASELKHRFTFTVVVLLAAVAHLAWEHFNGGIRSHYFFANPSYPAMSNAWGLLILPALAWFLSGPIAKRGLTRWTVAGFVTALLYGVALSLTFVFKRTDLTMPLFLAAFVISVFAPVYRGEFLLGFVLGMTPTFGPIIPTVFAGVFAVIALIAQRVLYPIMKRIMLSLRETGPHAHRN